ncbi:PilZ domain-containing protein [Brevibacillus fluminis]|uniref:PilZ domain-containing protein n=1 Tax=Brevibacillus fluminis TaxID=511487 RepID=UPI003F8A2024
MEKNEKVRELMKMLYQRKEGFRYRFPTPHDAMLTIEQGERPVGQKDQVKLLDISLGGAKVSAPGLNIRYAQEPKHVSLSFLLNEKPFTIRGMMIWKQLYLGEYRYGIRFEAERYSQSELLNELKKCAKREASC